VGNYGFQCDIWSVGVLTYIMLSGSLPFHGKDDHETLGLISCGFDPIVGFKSKIWSNVSDECK
jgi:serine/threonine protein kinase